MDETVVPAANHHLRAASHACVYSRLGQPYAVNGVMWVPRNRVDIPPRVAPHYVSDVTNAIQCCGIGRATARLYIS
jgi:hypothetical protein